MENCKRVLIVGHSAKEYALAKVLSKNENIKEIYVAPGNQAVEEFATRIDIREDDTSALLEFAIKNEIDLTIASSTVALEADIVSDFRENSQMIFAPDKQCASFIFSKAAGKKYAYKLHLPVAKFGIFEKAQMAVDYLKNSPMPVLVTSDYDSETSVKAVCTTVQSAITTVNDIFFRNEDRAVVEQYVYGHPFTCYVITDGYEVLPLAVVGDYKFQENGDAGLFTSGVGAYLPDYKISFDLINDIMSNVVSKILTNLLNKGTPYCGILGIELVLQEENKYTIVGFTPFLKDHDAQCVLNSIDLDLYSLMEACANGSFADDYTEIPIKDYSIISCVLTAKNEGSVINGLELVDDTTDIGYFNTKKNKYLETLTNKGRTLVITQTSSTFSRARELLYDNIEAISFDGMKYRKDICSDRS